MFFASICNKKIKMFHVKQQQEAEKMEYKKILEAFGELPENKRPIIERLVKDFCKWSNISEQLEGLPTFEIDPNNPKRQRKLPAHDMLKDAQQRTTELARALLRVIDGEVEEESPLMQMIREFRNDGA